MSDGGHKQYKFDVKKLVKECGGATELAATIEINPRTPYRWIQQGHVNSAILAKIATFYDVDLNKYLIKVDCP